jgi:lipopolysaccharide transport system permease protein
MSYQILPNCFCESGVSVVPNAIFPLFSSLVFGLVFGKFVKFGSNGMPNAQFYLSGFILWGFFAECITKTSSLFRDNMNLFGKVYFPRIIIPIGIIGSALIRLFLQLLLLLLITVWLSLKGIHFELGLHLFCIPLSILMMAILGLGFGLIVAATTTRYRDLTLIINFGLQLLLFSTTVIYPASSLPEPYRNIIGLNPISVCIDLFRIGFGASNTINLFSLIVCLSFLILMPILGFMLFHKVEKNFIDTI